MLPGSSTTRHVSLPLDAAVRLHPADDLPTCDECTSAWVQARRVRPAALVAVAHCCCRLAAGNGALCRCHLVLTQSTGTALLHHHQHCAQARLLPGRFIRQAALLLAQVMVVCDALLVQCCAVDGDAAGWIM